MDPSLLDMAAKMSSCHELPKKYIRRLAWEAQRKIEQHSEPCKNSGITKPAQFRRLNVGYATRLGFAQLNQYSRVTLQIERAIANGKDSRRRTR